MSPPKIHNIISIVGDVFNAPERYATSTRRHDELVKPRHAAMWLARNFTDASYKKIGNAFGDRDHTTVMSACARVDRLIYDDAEFGSKLAECRNRVNLFSPEDQIIFLGRRKDFDVSVSTILKLMWSRFSKRFQRG